MSRTKVLSIVGPGRSGTTILTSVLGQTEGFLNVGELRWLWRRGLLEGRACGCGAPSLQACPLWSRVIEKVSAGRVATDLAAEIGGALEELAWRRHRLRVIREATAGSSQWPALEQVRQVSEGLISAIAEVTGARVVVDSSKRAQDAAVIAGLDEVEHYVLHMVRDPAAVIHSWQRRDKTTHAADGARTMATRGFLPSMVRWSENCLGAEALHQRMPGGRWMFVRYEDFAAAPRATVARILSFLGEDVPPPFVDEDTVVLDVNHTVAGNPNRFRVGPVQVRADDEWRRRMPHRQQLAVRALSWPLLLRYGYSLDTRSVVGARA
ncbi:sulfotransferase [Geodermatophilus marinus]|uniref:sulfotransferase n=1 Tax=Geodermatophilus sp. LHW52908 TaxID=2303986 RepID=UPI001313D89E|nr:sulfotransferase [Geodermatophilus sp. LHW52908]